MVDFCHKTFYGRNLQMVVIVFVPGRPLPSVLFPVNLEPFEVKHLLVFHFLALIGRLLALFANITLGWKDLEGTNIKAYQQLL